MAMYTQADLANSLINLTIAVPHKEAIQKE